MTVQFNLLPDVKLEYIKTRKTKSRVVSIAVIAATVSFGLVILLFLAVNVVQKQHLNNLNKDIQQDTATLQSNPDLEKVLTIQNQLNSLPALHDQKPVSSRMLGYLTQITPVSATISSAEVDFANNTIKISGNASTIAVVNQYVDTLKFTDYTVEGSDEKKRAFSEVVQSQVGVSGPVFSYTIDFKFDPEIFNGTKNVKLEVPSIVSTRSTTEKPTDDLFKQQPQQTGGQ